LLRKILTWKELFLYFISNANCYINFILLQYSLFILIIFFLGKQSEINMINKQIVYNTQTVDIRSLQKIVDGRCRNDVGNAIRDNIAMNICDVFKSIKAKMFQHGSRVILEMTSSLPKPCVMT